MLAERRECVGQGGTQAAKWLEARVAPACHWKQLVWLRDCQSREAGPIPVGGALPFGSAGCGDLATNQVSGVRLLGGAL